ncbi:MAG TPA: redoxin domain-containing protein [Aliidongia sp.]|nr:redoxin domain-containing protein [Aliidongia sp.]
MRNPTNGATSDAAKYPGEPERSSAHGRLVSSLRAGDHAPEFRLDDGTGQIVSLFATLKTGPAVLSFLDSRDGSDLSSQLRALNDHAGRIAGYGASLLALSSIAPPSAPPSPRFKVLLDAGCDVASAYGLYPPPRTPLRQSSRAPRPNVEAATAAGPSPVPATFVISESAKIVMSLTDAAFDREIVSANVVSTLEALRLRQGARR